MEKAKDYYGDTVSELIVQACKELAVPQEELNIEVLETGSSGIFGLCRKRAHIRVTKKADCSAEDSAKKEFPLQPAERDGKQDNQPEEKDKTSIDKKPDTKKTSRKATVGKREKKNSENTGTSVQKEPESYVPPSEEALAAVRDDITTMLNLMGFPSSVTVVLEERTVVCQISEKYKDALIGQEGRTLDSLQYLLRKMTSRKLPDRTKLSLDVGNYRERRIVMLKEQALELAAKVKEDGTTLAIPALNPSERREVHMVLQEDKKIRSRSVGDGLFKKVLIYKPGKKKSYSRKGRGRQGGSSNSR